MLNQAARYFPILRILENYSGLAEPILEIGSGSFGLAHFYKGRVIGCDVKFRDSPEKNMLPVRCSGANLPFADSSFDTVVAPDVLEHVAPHLRPSVILEALRVTHRLALFAFPCGTEAHLQDEKLMEFYRKRNVPAPPWLEEHMQHPFPELELFLGLGEDWTMESFGNEHLRFHEWVIRGEMSRVWSRIFDICMWHASSLVRTAVRWADHPPFYRMVVVVTRRDSQGVRNGERTRS